MRWPWSKKTEDRSSATGFNDLVVAGLLARASGDRLNDPASTGAIEAAALIWATVLASATVKGNERVQSAVSRRYLAMVGEAVGPEGRGGARCPHFPEWPCTTPPVRELGCQWGCRPGKLVVSRGPVCSVQRGHYAPASRGGRSCIVGRQPGGAVEGCCPVAIGQLERRVARVSGAPAGTGSGLARGFRPDHPAGSGLRMEMRARTASAATQKRLGRWRVRYSWQKRRVRDGVRE